MRHTAQCACAQASIIVHGDPVMHGVCHCTNCKRRTGSAFGISAYFARASVVEVVGSTTVYAFHHSLGSQDQQRHFCSTCGTTLYWHVSTLPDLIGIAGGCFAETPLPDPTYSLTHEKKAHWLGLPASWDVYPQ